MFSAWELWKFSGYLTPALFVNQKYTHLIGHYK